MPASWFVSSADACHQHQPERLWQQVQALYQALPKHPEIWLALHYDGEQVPLAQRQPLLTLLYSLRLSMAANWHPKYQQLAAVACLSALLKHDPDYWRQRGVQHPLWLAALEQSHTPPAIRQHLRLILAVVAQHQQQAPQPQWRYWWQAALQQPQREIWQWLQQLAEQQYFSYGTPLQLTNKAGKSRRFWLLKCNADACLLVDEEHKRMQLPTSRLLTLSQPHDAQADPVSQRLDDAQLQRLSNTSYSRYWPKPESLSWQAPKTMLRALRRFADGDGDGKSLADTLRRYPALAEALRHSASHSSQPGSWSRPAALTTQQALLWLGPQRSAAHLAIASLEQQLQRRQFPLNRDLQQRQQLFAHCLSLLLAHTQLQLGVNSRLLSALFCADLQRQNALLRDPHWPRQGLIQQWHCSGWLGLGSDAIDTRFSRQLAQRWLQPDSVPRLLNAADWQPQQSLHGVLIAASAAVCWLLQSDWRWHNDAKQQWQQALQSCHLNPAQWQQLARRAALAQQTYCPL